MRSPTFANRCANLRVIRGFTIIKLLILIIKLLILIWLIWVDPEPLLPSTVAPPTLRGLPSLEVLSLPAIGGTGTPGSTVEVISNGQPLGVATVGENGRWQLMPQLPFSPGIYFLAAGAVDDNGDIIAAGPEGEGELNVVGLPTLEVSAAHRIDDAAEVSLFGEGTPHSTVRLVWNEEAITTIEVDADGRWQHSLPPARLPSTNVFVAQVLDRGGGILGASEPRELRPPVVARAPLRIERVEFDRLRRAAQREIVNGELTVGGTGEPGALIIVAREGDAISPATTVKGDGAWEVAAPLGLAPGEYSFAVRMTDPDGQALEEGAFNLAVSPPPTLRVEGGPSDVDDFFLSGTAQPNEALILYANGSTVATVEADGNGQWQYPTHLTAGLHRLFALSVTGLDSDPQDVSVALARPVILGQKRDEPDKSLPGFFGKGRPNVQMEIVEGSAVIGQVRVDAKGHWDCQCTLSPGEHTVYVREAAEPVRASERLTITVENPVPAFIPGTMAADAPPFRCPDPSPPGVVEGGVYIIGCGESLRLIATRLGVSVDALLAYNPQLSQPPLVYFGQRLNVPVGAACSDVIAES